MEPKKIAVFGGSGRTGVPFLTKALKEGYTIQALIRDPDRAPILNPNLTWIAGDVLNQEAVDLTLNGSQAVISLIGHVKNSPPNLQAAATQRIINSMNAQGIKRLISLTGGGVRNQLADKPGFFDDLIVFIMKNLTGKGPREALLDGIAHADLIRRSDLKWTIVRGPMLTNDPGKGSYLVGSVGTVKGFKLTREDLAAFIVDILIDETYIGEMPFLAN
jgi:putative NADH-flavin reductase